MHGARKEKILRYSCAHAVGDDETGLAHDRRTVRHRSRHPRQAGRRAAVCAAGQGQVAARCLWCLAQSETADVVGEIRYGQGDQLLAQSVTRADAVL